MNNKIFRIMLMPFVLLFAVITAAFSICTAEKTDALDIGGAAVEIERDGEFYDEVFDLSEALEIAADGDVLRLLDDVELSETLTVDKNITLDLSGFVIELNGGKAEVTSDFVLDDTNKTREHDTEINGETVLLNGGAVIGADGFAFTVTAGSMTLKGGTVTGNVGGVKITGDGGFSLIGGSIKGNSTDLYLGGSTVIDVVDTPASEIGITLENPDRVFADKFVENVFTSNNSSYAVAANKSGQAVLGEPCAVTFYDGNEVLFVKNTVKGGFVTADSAPVKQCRTFDGWVTENGTAVDLDAVSGNLSVYAVYSENHVYSDPVWQWNDDFTSASAFFTCSVCGHDKSLSATVTSETLENSSKFTATVEFDGRNYSETETVAKPTEPSTSENPETPESLETPPVQSTDGEEQLKPEPEDTEPDLPQFDKRWLILIIGGAVLVAGAIIFLVVKIKKR